MKTHTKRQVQSMISNYNVGRLISYKPTVKGYVNDNYIVKTTKGKYMLRVYKEPRKITELMYEVEFINYLVTKKFPYKIPQWLPNKSGKLLSDFKDLKYVMYKYIPGVIVKHPSDDQVKQVAKMIAITHKLVIGFKPKNKKNWGKAFRTSWQRGELNDYVPKAKKQNTIRSKMLLKNEKYYLRLLDEIDNKYKNVKLPRYVSHNDFTRNNILFRNGKLYGLIDFDNCNSDFRIKDLAKYMVYGLDTGHDIDLRKARLFVKEYRKYYYISDKELSYIPDVLIVEKIGAFVWIYDRMERGISKVKIDGLRLIVRYIKWIDENRDKIIEAVCG